MNALMRLEPHRRPQRDLQSNRRLERVAATAADLRTLAAHFLGGEPPLRDLMHVTAYVIMFAACLRYNDLAQLTCRRDHMRFSPAGVDLFLPRSKTDQAGVGTWVHVAALPHGAAGPCPVTLLRTLLQRGQYNRAEAQPLFYSLKNPGAVVSSGTLNTRLREMATAAGVDAKLTLHSFRIGAATAAAGAGMPLAAVMQLGRWRSEETCRQYIRGAAVLGAPPPSLSAALGL